MSDRGIRQHVEINAPAMRSGAIDYPGLLRAGLEELDFYDSRRHL